MAQPPSAPAVQITRSVTEMVTLQGPSSAVMAKAEQLRQAGYTMTDHYYTVLHDDDPFQTTIANLRRTLPNGFAMIDNAEVRNRIEQIIEAYCDGTYTNGLKSANFVGQPQACADEIIAAVYGMLEDETAALRAELATVKWVPVAERLPDHPNWVILQYEYVYPDQARWAVAPAICEKGEWRWSADPDDLIDTAYHRPVKWQPLREGENE